MLNLIGALAFKGLCQNRDRVASDFGYAILNDKSFPPFGVCVGDSSSNQARHHRHMSRKNAELSKFAFENNAFNPLFKGKTRRSYDF